MEPRQPLVCLVCFQTVGDGTLIQILVFFFYFISKLLKRVFEFQLPASAMQPGGGVSATTAINKT